MAHTLVPTEFNFTRLESVRNTLLLASTAAEVLGYPNPTTRPRRLDPVEVSEWIYAHPSFRMREVYEHHTKEDPRQEHLAF
jgi:hypothetical protein